MSAGKTIAVVRNRVPHSEEHVIIAEREQITAARVWAAECEWLDCDLLDEYSDAQIVRGVDRHYDGGWAQFIRDGIVS